MKSGEKAEASVLIRLAQSKNPADLFARLVEEDFTAPDHRAVFVQLRGLCRNGEPLAGNPAVLAMVGGLFPRMEAELVSDVAVDQMRNLTQRRRLQAAVSEIFERSKDLTITADALMAEAAGLIEKAWDERCAGNKVVNAEGMFFATMRDSIAAHQGERSAEITTGIPALDCLGKFREGDLVTIGGRTGAGKTAMAKSMAMGMLSAGVPIGYVCKEMTGTQFGYRMLAQETGIDAKVLERGSYAAADRPKIEEAAAKLSLYRDQWQFSNAKTLFEAVADCRRWHDKFGTKVFFMDYVQQFSVPGVSSVRERVMAISDAFKFLALDHGCVTVALAQLSRAAVQQGKLAPPRVDHFKESGSIEEDSDRTWLLWNARKEAGQVDEGAAYPFYDYFDRQRVNLLGRHGNDNRIGLLCPKYRGGEAYQTALAFHGPTTSMYRPAKDWE